MIIGSHAILHKDKEIVLLKRSDNAPTNKREWSLPGGTIKEESDLERVIIEIDEEIKGIRYKGLKRFKKVRVIGYKDKYVSFFEASVECIEQVVGYASNESIGIAFFNEREIEKIEICYEHRIAIDEWIETRNCGAMYEK